MAFLSKNSRFINTVLMGGDFSAKLTAIAEAGFSGVELWQQDVENAVAQTRAQLDTLNLARTDYQVLLNYDGAVGETRHEKQQEALRMITLATEIGSPMILVAANTTQCDRGTIVSDLKGLCQQANKAGLRVAYEGMAWSTEVDQCDKAWQIIQQVDEPNLGLVVDAFHLYVLGRSLRDLDGIPAEKIFLVQLSDYDRQPVHEDIKTIARHQRLLPGEGCFPLNELIAYLDAIGYQGPIGLEVFNDEAVKEDARIVAKRAKQALEKILAKH